MTKQWLKLITNDDNFNPQSTDFKKKKVQLNKENLINKIEKLKFGFFTFRLNVFFRG